MTLQYISPNEDIDYNGLTTFLPAFDQINGWINNATWVEFNYGEAADLYVGWQTYTLGANERCKSAKLYLEYATFVALFLECYYSDHLSNYEPAGTLIYGAPTAEDQVGFSGVRTAPGGGEWTQSKLDNLRVLFHQASLEAQTILYDALIELDIRTRPVVNSITAPTGAQSTRKPTVSFTRTINDTEWGDSQKKFQVKIFKSDVYGGGGFSPDTSPAAYTATVNGTATTHTLVSMIGDGTFKAYVRVAKDFNFTDWYSPWFAQTGTFTITDPPPLPTNITPATGATVTTDRPILGGTVTQPTLLARSRIQWQMATDAGFTTNLKTVTEPLTDVRLSGPTSEITTAAAELFQTTWHIHARQVDEFGTASTSWTTGHTFVVTHPPSTANHTPTGGQTVGFGIGTDVSILHDWRFTDPSPYDFQTAYQIIAEYNADGTVYFDTGKIISAADEGFITYDEAVKETLMRWKVRVWDSDDVVGAYSNYQLFVPADPPITSILSPANGADYNNPVPVVTWSSVFGGSRFQQQYRVTIGAGTTYDTGTTFYDSEWLEGAATTHNTGDQLFENGVYYWVRVEVQDNSGLLGSDTNFFRAQWDAPDTPKLTVWLETIKNGFVNLTWTNEEIDDNFVRYELRRRVWTPGPSPSHFLRTEGAGDVSTPSIPDLNINDVRVRVALDDWSAAGSYTVASQWNEQDDQRGWAVKITDGFMQFVHSTTGVDVVSNLSSAFLPFSSGKAWLRYKFIGDDGAGNHIYQYSYSLDNTDDDEAVGWSLLDSNALGGTSSIFDSTAPLRVNGLQDDGGVVVEQSPANYYVATFRNETTKVADVRFRTFLPYTDEYGRVWTHAGDAHLEVEPVPPSQLGPWDLLYTTTENQDRYSFDDWMIGTHIDYEWALTQVGIRFDIETSAPYDREIGRPMADDYWLIHPTDKSKSVRLHHVTDDSMKEEWEQELLHILGRGRHQDIGDRLGWMGSLSAHLRDQEDLSGREQREALETLKAEKVDAYLRNPFGDLFRVAVGEIDIDREPGIGSGEREYSTVQLDYTEVLDT